MAPRDGDMTANAVQAPQTERDPNLPRSFFVGPDGAIHRDLTPRSARAKMVCTCPRKKISSKSGAQMHAPATLSTMSPRLQ